MANGVDHCGLACKPQLGCLLSNVREHSVLIAGTGVLLSAQTVGGMLSDPGGDA